MLKKNGAVARNCTFAVVPNRLSLSIHSANFCTQNALPALRSVIAIRPGAAMIYGWCRFRGPPSRAVQLEVSPVSQRIAIAPMPSAGVGFAMSIGAAGKAQKLAVSFASPLKVWKGDWLSATANEGVDAVRGIRTRFKTASCVVAC